MSQHGGNRWLHTSQPRILVVDDEPDIRELISLTLNRMGLLSDAVAGIKEAMDALTARTYHLCLTDMRLPDGEGLDLVRHIAEHHPRIPVAVITAYGSTENAVMALKSGAFDYVSKPVGLEALRTLIKSALKLASDPSDERHSKSDQGSGELTGNSPAMQHVRQMIDKVARSQAPVHISGESGSGKELAAKNIHLQSPRSEKPFIPVNCGAIPEPLMESEFFGYRKGAFTGAESERDGFFQAAHGGTLFLDEVADLPLTMQVKLLRAIQERKVRKVGSTSEDPVDIRIVSATHKNLKKCVEEGKFRQDLFYRINVIELRMPPLRECKEDIPLLAKRLLQRQNDEITARAMELLMDYAFPGNVRELENILERASALCSNHCIEEGDLQLTPVIDETSHPLASPDSGRNDFSSETLQDYLDRIEKQLIVEALAKTSGNRTAAAKHLGLSFRSLRYRIERLAIEVD